MNLPVQHCVPTPLGPMRLAAGPRGLMGAWFMEDAYGPGLERVEHWPHDPHHPILVKAAVQLNAYFRDERQSFDLPLDLDTGTAFQVAAWSALLAIPWGETISYGELARRMGKPSASRAAGAAIGRNPLSIIVPCHRVVGANGSLTGYAGGLGRKASLLQIEKRGPLL